MISQCFDPRFLEHPLSRSVGPDTENARSGIFSVSPCPTISLPSSLCHPGSSIPINGDFEGSLTERPRTHRETGKEFTKGGQSWVTIEMLPDVALLRIFEFYGHLGLSSLEWWQMLVHVCRKWRSVVFGSPRRLRLVLVCKASTPVRETLDIWPRLPLVIHGYSCEKWGVDNIIAALEHNDRIYEIVARDLDIQSSQCEKLLAAMRRPFPTLFRLEFQPKHETSPVDPDSFLGGLASQLQLLSLHSIPFPRLPKLLLSATYLTRLNLLNIPHSGYISPEVMVTCVSMLTRLEKLDIRFKSPQSRPDRERRRPPPSTRTLLPVFTHLGFTGVSEYLEDFVARIDAPLLDQLHILFFHQMIFDTPQLTQLIHRTPKFKAHNEAHVWFSDGRAGVSLDPDLGLAISCGQSDWQLSSVAQICNSSFQVPNSAVEHLHMEAAFWDSSWQDDIEIDQWLELLRPFTAVKSLYISQRFAPCIAPALKELVGERVTEVLPALQTLFLENPFSPRPVDWQETIEQFVAARQLSSHPISLLRLEKEQFEIL